MDKMSSRPAGADNSDKHQEQDVSSVSSDRMNPQMIADSLLSALEGGDFDRLQQARHTFVEEYSSRQDMSLPDLAGLLERRLAPRTATKDGARSEERRVGKE